MLKPKAKILSSFLLCLLLSGFSAGDGTRSFYRRRLVYEVEPNEPTANVKGRAKNTFRTKVPAPVSESNLWSELDQQEDADAWQRLLHDYDMSMDCIPLEYQKKSKSKSSKSRHHSKFQKRGYEYRG